MNDYDRDVEVALDAALEREKVLRAEIEVLRGGIFPRSCCLEDDVKVESVTYKVDVCVIAPVGEAIDKFIALRAIGIFKKQLDEDFEEVT